MGIMATRRSGAMAQLLEKARGDVFAVNCPSRSVLQHVTSRWGVLILVALLSKSFRFGELRRKVAGVSEKMLSQTLTALEQDGFVKREVLPTTPPRVDYSLTPLGREVAEQVEILADFIEDNLSKVMRARSQFRRERLHSAEDN